VSRFASISRIAGPAIALAAALAVVFVLGAGLLGGDPKPSNPPGSTPSPTANPTPTPVPTATPSPTGPTAGGPLTVDLDVADDHDVSVSITDRTGTLQKAVTGQTGDGMSVRWGDWTAENVDASTIRLTWVGLPRDEALTLSIAKTGSTYRLKLVQAAPPKDSDAVGFDRVLVLTFDSPVSASDFEVTLEEAAA
jgi:hypothetical protein